MDYPHGQRDLCGPEGSGLKGGRREQVRGYRAKPTKRERVPRHRIYGILLNAALSLAPHAPKAYYHAHAHAGLRAIAAGWPQAAAPAS